MTQRPRILVVQGKAHATALARCEPDADLVWADSVPSAIALLQKERFDGVYADTSDLALLRRAGSVIQADRILEALVDGVVLVDPDLRIVWANAEFRKWCSAAPSIEGKTFYEALESPDILGPEYSPFHSALSHGPSCTRLHLPGGRYVQLHVTPIRDPKGDISHYIGVGRDITAEHQQQQKLDAIHRAGRELADIDAKELAQMALEERIELLKSNILRYAHDLLHYDVVEIRLLDRTTNRLDTLIAEGVTPEAKSRVLYAQAQGNGVTGFVAATGKSYLCPDTATDPLYIEGAAGARSSLTVPLLYADQVIGTFNVESPQLNAFTEQDQQFLEIFSREIADSLHTLELLTAEKRGTATQSIEAISREVAIPVDEILTSASAVLDRYIGVDAEMADELRQILSSARAIKLTIQKVGETLAPAPAVEKAAEPSPHRLKGLRILVVDSDDRVRRSAHSILGRFGCVVEAAPEGKEAVSMARLNPYDVLLADIRLPDMTGHEVFQKLKQVRPNVPVVLMSAYGYDPSHSIVKCRQEGLRGVLFKPFRVEQLVDVLEKIPETKPAAPLAVRT